MALETEWPACHQRSWDLELTLCSPSPLPWQPGCSLPVVSTAVLKILCMCITLLK